MAKRKDYFQMRLTAEDSAIFEELEADYGLDRTNLVRHMLEYVREHRPAFKIVPETKEYAPVLEAA